MKTLPAALISKVLAVGFLVACTEQTGGLRGGDLPAIQGKATAAESAMATADSQLVREWNQQVIVTAKAQPALLDADISRAFAMLNVAMYDAVNGIEKKRTPALVAPTHLARGPQAAAAAQAAHA